MKSDVNCSGKQPLKIEVAKESMVPVSPDWTMFVKQQTLGQGAYGTVYKVKSLKTSMVLGGSEGVRVVLNSPTMRMKRKLNKNMLGSNMQSTIEKQNKVRSLVMDQNYVIKEIDTALLPKEAAFEALQEIEILSELDSHYVVGYYDSFIDGSTINIIQEFCQHGDLNTYIRKQNGKSLIENFIWKVFIQLCLGVHYLHSKNIIHRDIKSLNIFLTKDNSAKLGDFGAARRVAEENSAILDQPLEQIGEDEAFGEEKPPQKVGTPYYLAPELWQDKPCSRKSDVYAIGVVLYELCALKFPFDANDMEELENKVLKEKYSIPITVNKEFKTIIQKCLQKKPEQRPSIEEIILDDIFQRKSQLNKITLPLSLNKLKQQKIKAVEEVDVSVSAEPENSLHLSQRKMSSGEFNRSSSDRNLTSLGRQSPRTTQPTVKHSTVKFSAAKKSAQGKEPKVEPKVST
jgi:serine/threonine protein kinase